LAVVEKDPYRGLSPTVRDVWNVLTDVETQLETADREGIDVKVVSAPLASIESVSTRHGDELATRINDALRQGVAEYAPRLVALATVDAYRGDAGAEEARSAVDELGFPGIVVDVAKGDLLLSAPEARPTLDFAAERGIAVFAHPVTPSPLPGRFAALGRPGTVFARGTESSLSTYSLLASGLLDDLPGLRIVIAGIGAAAVLLGASLYGSTAETLPQKVWTNLYVDTMGFDPAAARFLINALGLERVLIGSDWPIAWRQASRLRVDAFFDELGLEAVGRDLLASGTARKLLLPQAALRC
jgi:predicted TIM-barrel fold metal-dependent hydrolase